MPQNFQDQKYRGKIKHRWKIKRGKIKHSPVRDFWKSTLFDPFSQKWRSPLFGVSSVHYITHNSRHAEHYAFTQREIIHQETSTMDFVSKKCEEPPETRLISNWIVKVLIILVVLQMFLIVYCLCSKSSKRNSQMYQRYTDEQLDMKTFFFE